MSTSKILHKFISPPQCFLTLYFLLLNLLEEIFIWLQTQSINFVESRSLFCPSSQIHPEIQGTQSEKKKSPKISHFFLLLFPQFFLVKVTRPKDILNCCSVHFQSTYRDGVHKRQCKMYFTALGQKWKLSLSMILKPVLQ